MSMTRRPAGASGHGLVGRRAHVDEEERRDVALLALARLVELRRRRVAGAPIGARGDHRVEVEVLAVLEPVDHAIALGPDALELAAHLGQQVGVRGERLVEEVAGVALERDLGEPAPGVAVVADPVIPLVVEELAVAGRLRQRGGAARLRLPQQALQLGHALARQLAGEVGDVEPERGEILAAALRGGDARALL